MNELRELKCVQPTTDAHWTGNFKDVIKSVIIVFISTSDSELITVDMFTIIIN